MHLEPEAPAVVGEAEDVVVRRADEQPLDEILILQTLTAQPRPPRRCFRYVETDVRLM